MNGRYKMILFCRRPKQTIKDNEFIFINIRKNEEYKFLKQQYIYINI